MLLRPGAVSPEQLRAILPDLEISSGVEGILAKNEVVRSPGLHYRHYAPRAKCRLIIGDIQQFKGFLQTQSKQNFCVIGYDEEQNICKNFISIGRYGDIADNARRIFDALRRTDGAELVYIHFQKDLSGISLAIYNRLMRAADFDIVYL